MRAAAQLPFASNSDQCKQNDRNEDVEQQRDSPEFVNLRHSVKGCHYARVILLVTLHNQWPYVLERSIRKYCHRSSKMKWPANSIDRNGVVLEQSTAPKEIHPQQRYRKEDQRERRLKVKLPELHPLTSIIVCSELTQDTKRNERFQSQKMPEN